MDSPGVAGYRKAKSGVALDARSSDGAGVGFWGEDGLADADRLELLRSKAILDGEPVARRPGPGRPERMHGPDAVRI
jgi:hypothetical protein